MRSAREVDAVLPKADYLEGIHSLEAVFVKPGVTPEPGPLLHQASRWRMKAAPNDAALYQAQPLQHRGQACAIAAQVANGGFESG
jgi:hypothetical protein